MHCGPHGPASNFRRCRARFMAPVPGPVLSEPTLRVGFASRLFLWARLRGIAPQAKNQKKPPLVPRRGARPRGLRAPLETPGLCGGRPRLFPCFTALHSFLPWPRPVPAGTAHPGSRSETPPAFAGGPFPGRRTRRPYMQQVLVRQTPKPRLPNCAAARKFPACRDVVRRGQDARPTNLRDLRMNIVNRKFPPGRRAGS